MQLATFGGEATAFEGGVLAIGRFADGEPSAAEKAIDAALDGALSTAAERLLFKGKARQSVAIDTLGRIGADRVILLGLGDAADLGAAGLRDYAALAIAEGRTHRLDDVGIVPPTDDLEELVKGAVLGAYSWHALQADDESAPRFGINKAHLLTRADASAAIKHGTIVAEAVCEARDMVNEPPNVCTPERLAQFAQNMAKRPGVTVTVFDRAEIERRKMGGVIAVSQGATREPRFVHIQYTPPSGKTDDAIALIGKGITFDAGGLSLKPPKAQIEMYIDMAGAGAVLGAMEAITRLQPDVPVHGIVGACENMPGGNSYRPSDVLTMYSGKTVEVLNTDAEGRLVLADALHYANDLKPRAMVDLATLTGACMVGLGQFTAALYSDDEDWAAELQAATKTADEKFWRMPLDPKLADSLKSKRADITNLGGQWGGSITAAQFLQHFKGETTWGHMDIAGPVLAAADDGYIRVGATGFGVMTLVALVESA
jgi:leucyl aminopeptidase